MERRGFFRFLAGLPFVAAIRPRQRFLLLLDRLGRKPEAGASPPLPPHGERRLVTLWDVYTPYERATFWGDLEVWRDAQSPLGHFVTVLREEAPKEKRDADAD